MVVNIIALLLFWILAPIIGFYVSIFLYVCLIVIFIEGKWRYGDILKAFIYTFFFVIFLYVIFSLFLRIRAPSGFLM